MRIRMIGVDLDGTLLDSTGNLSRHNREAVHAAQDRGLLVVPCTGRGWIESHRALADLTGLTLGVFVGGAMVADVNTGQSMNVAPFEPDLALQLLDHLDDIPEAVLVFRDAATVGHDYLVTGSGELSENTRWWFRTNNVRVHYQRRVTAKDLTATLRIGCVGEHSRMVAITDRIHASLYGQVVLHYLEGVTNPGPDQSVHLLEAFAPNVDKWRGLTWIAQQSGIEPGEIAVIGDQINDLAMVQAAGCSIAMGNAVDAVKQAADHLTGTNDDHGVAHAIERLLTGHWT